MLNLALFYALICPETDLQDLRWLSMVPSNHFCFLYQS